MFEVLFIHVLNGRRVADTIEVSASTLYEASEKFWEFAHKNAINAIKYIEFERSENLISDEEDYEIEDLGDGLL